MRVTVPSRTVPARPILYTVDGCQMYGRNRIRLRWTPLISAPLHLKHGPSTIKFETARCTQYTEQSGLPLSPALERLESPSDSDHAGSRTAYPHYTQVCSRSIILQKLGTRWPS